jgi:hypothetical protein
MMAGNINNEIQALSADMQIGKLTTWDTYVRERVMDNRNLLDKVSHAISTYEGRLASARQELENTERSLGA